ncbi:uncharacterized protein LOC108697552 isoform X3 [Xenopus laevis]|uniref:Uncharacterized protein LOC108697552 isoform X3 n=1 Tax=Xenopus laevis TaxID=8355 RepID=A0A8J1MNN3_XENLA|nr:uncharacterized protein LOC108697552 isoform X3 [Xenopus laevis]
MALRSCWLFGILLLYLRSVKGEEKDIFMNGTINRNITLPSAPFESMGEWFFYGQVKDLKTENKKSLFYTDNKFPDKLHNATNTRVRPGANGSLVIKYLCKEDEGLYLFEYDDSKRYIHLSLFDEEQKNITGNSTDLGISPITTSSAAGNQYKWKIWIMIAVCCAGCCLVFGSALALSTLSISARQPHVSGTPNSSVLLSTSYSTLPHTDWLQLKWESLTPKTDLIKCTIRTMELENVHINTYPVGGREGRMEIVSDNGSLIIHRLKMSDMGSYQVTIRDSRASASAIISVTVQDIGTWNLPL